MIAQPPAGVVAKRSRGRVLSQQGRERREGGYFADLLCCAQNIAGLTANFCACNLAACERGEGGEGGEQACGRKTRCKERGDNCGGDCDPAGAGRRAPDGLTEPC